MHNNRVATMSPRNQAEGWRGAEGGRTDSEAPALPFRDILPHQLGSATANFNFFRQLTGALAVAVFGAIVLGGDVHASLARHGLESVSPGSGAEFLQRFRYVFAVAAVAFLAFLASMIALFLMKPPSF